MIGESGFEAQAGPTIVSGYSGVCFEIKFSGRHRGFDGVLFNSPYNGSTAEKKYIIKKLNNLTKVE